MGLALILGTAAAYGFSRWPLRGTQTYLLLVLTARMLPPIVLVVPLFLFFRVTGLAGGYLSIILLYTAFNLPFTIWDHEELLRRTPAGGGGCRPHGWKLGTGCVLPHLPAAGARRLAATATLGLILTWNEFLMALLLTGPRTRTVPVAIGSNLGGGIAIEWSRLAAIETLFLLPVALAAFLLQNHLLRGVTFGTVSRRPPPGGNATNGRSEWI